MCVEQQRGEFIPIYSCCKGHQLFINLARRTWSTTEDSLRQTHQTSGFYVPWATLIFIAKEGRVQINFYFLARSRESFRDVGTSTPSSSQLSLPKSSGNGDEIDFMRRLHRRGLSTSRRHDKWQPQLSGINISRFISFSWSNTFELIKVDDSSAPHFSLGLWASKPERERDREEALCLSM